MEIISSSPETCFVFSTFGRAEIARKSFASLTSALAQYRKQVKIIITDATNDEEKMKWATQSDADDVILTPRFTSNATSRNLAMTLIMDKYSPKYLCMLEDDFEYTADWYPCLVEATNRLYGVISPFNLAYGIFSAGPEPNKERCKIDIVNGVTAYIFGSIASQRFMPTFHYLSVMRMWDPDLLGISYAQTGGQTFRNTMRGYCGAVLPPKLSWPIDEDQTKSTWVGKRDPGPPAHSLNLEEYKVIESAAHKIGSYSNVQPEQKKTIIQRLRNVITLLR
jgi:hypothetical protein